jgi:Rab-GTPase-TBC domain
LSNESVKRLPSTYERPWLLLQRRSRVEKDVRRTDRGVPFFAGSRNPNVAMLRRILLTYSIYNFDLSYCQARLVMRFGRVLAAGLSYLVRLSVTLNWLAA